MMNNKIKFIIFTAVLFTTLIVGKSVSAAITIRPALNLGLVGYWSMDEGSGSKAYDQSGNRNTGTAYSSTTPTASWADGKLGKALDFDGTDDYVNIPTASSINITSNITVSAWINIKVWKEADVVESGNTGYMLWTAPSQANKIVWGRQGSTAGQVLSVTTFNTKLNTWYHIVGTHDGTTLRIYVNGVVDNTKVAATSFSNGANLFIASGLDGKFNGLIDEVRVYNRALSAGEVNRLYNLTKPKIKAASDLGLVGYWSFEEGLGTKAGDMSGNGNTGTLTGPTHLPTWVDGKRGKALNFDKVDDYVTATIPLPSTATFSFWATWNGVQSAMPFLAGAYGAGPDVFFDTDKISWNTWNSSSNPFCSIPVSASDGQFHHYIVIAQSGNTKLYYDGSLCGTATYASPAGSTFIIGGTAGNPPYLWGGKIDEVRIYNRALSASEVASLYSASKKIMKVNASQNSKLTTGLVGMWSFNGPDMFSSTLAKDVTGNGYTGTIYGATLDSGKVGQGILLDEAADGRIDIANSADLAEGSALTVSAWIKYTVLPATADDYIITKERSGFPEWNMQRARENSTGKLEFTVTNASDTTVSAASDAAFPTDLDWHHVAGVYDGQNVYIYGDGVSLDSSTNALTGNIKDLTHRICISASWTGSACGTGGNFHGTMDEVRVYNRALSAAEIKRLYNLGK